MAEITMADIVKLRKMTMAGMMDCKKALAEANGDMDRAVEIIREKGKLVASKRADRNASEGVVVARVVGNKAYMVCLACETDFVAKNEDFAKSANQILEIAIKNDVADLAALMETKEAGRTVADLVSEKAGQTGEKVELPFYGCIEAPYCAEYVHINHKVGSLIGFNKEVPAELAHDIAMQATAMAPVAIDENSCPKEVIEKEYEIGREQARLEGKPENMLDKIAEGKVKKFFKENTLWNQDFVKNPKESVGDHIKAVDKDAKVVAYVRFSLND